MVRNEDQAGVGCRRLMCSVNEHKHTEYKGNTAEGFYAGKYDQLHILS